MKIARPGESVREHLENVSAKCEEMCAKFGMPNFGKVIGMCHDAYKDSDEWQAYISKKIAWEQGGKKDPNPGIVPHAIESAVYLAWRLGNAMPNEILAQVISEMMGQCIVSHHNGLHNYTDPNTSRHFIDPIDKIYQVNGKASVAATKQEVLARTGMDFTTIDDSMFDSVFTKRMINGLMSESAKMANGGNGDLFVRMMYSCLVDADRLDAEIKGQDGLKKDAMRNDPAVAGMDELLRMFEAEMGRLASSPSAFKEINVLRTDVRNNVLSMAHGKRGIYNLVLPTGAGKTYAGMHFALKHAGFHKMDRIIILAPLTTVVDQTANEYTRIFTDVNVIEHQCDFDALDKYDANGDPIRGFRDDMDELEERMALIVENWNLPVIVTTTVQFFESLLQYKSGSARKIHNIANSVIIIDEEQQLPLNQIYPITHVLNALVKDFGCTVVRSTATLPAFDKEIEVGPGKYVQGYNGSIDLVDNVDKLFDKFKRAEVVFVGEKPSDEIAYEISDNLKSYLCVVNTRRKCRDLFSKVNKDDNDKYMLSKDICPKDRKRMIKEISARLEKGDKITVVATSLVEAGVDFDFDAALREMNSLYSILQTRGRCNRHGRQKMGRVEVFEFSDMPTRPGEDAYEKAEITRNCLVMGQLPSNIGEHQISLNYSNQNNFKKGDAILGSERNFNDAMYKQANSNVEKLRSQMRLFNYQEFGENFHMIEAHRYFPVVVMYRENDNDDTIDKLINESKHHFNKKMQRKFQQYIVEVNTWVAKDLEINGLLEELECQGRKLGLYVLNEIDFAKKKTYVNGKGIVFENGLNCTLII